VSSNSTRRTVGFIVTLAVGAVLLVTGVALRAHHIQLEEAALHATETASVPDTSTPTRMPTATPSSTNTALDTLTPSPTLTPSETPTPTWTPLPIEGTYTTPLTPPATAIPTAVPTIEVPDDVITIALLGSDNELIHSLFRSDTIIIVSINQTEGTVSTLSLMRDLYVYIPGWTMHRINVATSLGGPDLLRETLLYNFGFDFDYYARVDFEGFKRIIDAVGGIDVPVDCAMEEWRLIDPEMDVNDPESWDIYRLDVGVHHMDGDLALWYARSRGVSSNDFDRIRRQQRVLRALWAQSRDLNLIPRIPELWADLNDAIETDMTLADILRLAPIAANLDSSRIRSYVTTGDMVTNWTNPENGAQVLIPVPEAMQQVIAQAMQPPAANYAAEQTALVEVRNGTATERLDEVAADRLAQEGLLATATGPADEMLPETVIYDYTGRIKAEQLTTIQLALRVPDENVIVQLDPNRTVDYLVIIGDDYESCTWRGAPLPSEVTPSDTETPTGDIAPTPTP
jgi:LCP family protein required for cell wall assembly